MVHKIYLTLHWLGLLLLFSGTSTALEPIDSREPTIWFGPNVVDPVQAGIGKAIPDVSFTRLYGGNETLYQVTGAKGTMVFVRDPECPVSQRYGPRSAELAKWYAERGIGSVFIYLNNNLGADALLQDAARLNTEGVLAGQGSFRLAEHLQVVSTGDAFLLNANRELVYRGAIDDQYGFGYTRDAPTRYYLRNAMDSLLQDKAVGIPATSAPGCVIDADPAKDRLFPNIPYDAEVS